MCIVRLYRNIDDSTFKSCFIVFLWNGARIAQGSRHGQSEVGPSAKVCVDETLSLLLGPNLMFLKAVTSAFRARPNLT